jgi:hypothetical protein
MSLSAKTVLFDAAASLYYAPESNTHSTAKREDPMNDQHEQTIDAKAGTAEPARQTFSEWIQDPLGSVIAASVATIGSFGVVISGMWAINVALN